MLSAGAISGMDWRWRAENEKFLAGCDSGGSRATVKVVAGPLLLGERELKYFGQRQRCRLSIIVRRGVIAFDIGTAEWLRLEKGKRVFDNRNGCCCRDFVPTPIENFDYRTNITATHSKDNRNSNSIAKSITKFVLLFNYIELFSPVGSLPPST